MGCVGGADWDTLQLHCVGGADRGTHCIVWDPEELTVGHIAYGRS